MKTKHVFISILLMGCVFLNQKNAVAQAFCRFTLSGKVIDEHDSQALSFANIYIKELELGAISDTAGNYVIPDLCEGKYTVQCSHLGCDPIIMEVEINGNTVQDFYPEHHSELLAEAIIVAEKLQEEFTQGKQSLSKKVMNENKGQSIGETLKQVTGVTTLSTGNSIAKPVIHGLHSNRILMLNNGVRQEGQQWGNEHAPEIDPFIADELTVVKGANSVRFGPDAIAGVIIVNPKPFRDSSGLGGELSLVGFSNGRQGTASGMLEGSPNKLPEFSWRAQGTFKRGGNVNSPNYYLKNTALKEYNFSWAAKYEKPTYGVEAFYSQFNTDIGVFSAAHIGNLTDLQRAFEAEEPLESSSFSYNIDRPWQHVEHELFKANGYVRTGDVGKLNITYARQYNKRLEYDKHAPLNDSLAALNLPALQFEITTHTTDVVWEHKRFKSLKGSLGVSGIQQGNTYEGRFFIPNYKKYGGGAFAVERWKQNGSKLEIEGGVRFDYIAQEVFMWQGGEVASNHHNYNNFSGSLGSVYKLSNKLLLRANAGTAWRPPNVSELYSDGVHHGAAAVEVGDNSLVAEQAYNLSTTAEYSGEKLNVTLDGYYNYIHNFIYLKPVLPPTLTIRGAFPTFHFSQVNATLKGIDVTVSYDFPKNLSIASKVSVLRAFNETVDEYLVQMPADRFENREEYKFSDQKTFKDGYIALTVLTVMKQTRVPVNSDFVLPPNAYTLLGAQVGFAIPVGEHQMNIGIGINNLLNTVYREYLNRFRYYTDEMGTNVSLRLNIPFTIIKSKH